MWDPAHRLELSEEHSRKLAQIIQKFYTMVHTQIKYFHVGKNIHEAKLMNAKSYEPLQVSNTRFVAHEHPVLCNQYHNWPIQSSHWEHHAQEI